MFIIIMQVINMHVVGKKGGNSEKGGKRAVSSNYTLNNKTLTITVCALVFRTHHGKRQASRIR
jgi:hypothetical protein